MKESYSKGIATHAGPESCEGVREDALEALTGGTAGRDIGRRNQDKLQGAEALMACGRQHQAARKGESGLIPARSKTHGMPGRLRRRSWEIPGSTARGARRPPREPLRGHDEDARTWEVGQAHSTRETTEQRERARALLAEVAEGRGLAEGEASSAKQPPGAVPD
jgi:hypothetical protein